MSLDAVAPQNVSVGQTLQVALVVRNPQGHALSYAFLGPELPELSRVARITGNATGGEFYYRPLATHAGTHEFTFVVSGDSGTQRRTTTITVQPAPDTAPVFLRPAAGATFDLATDPCVRFDVDVRDVDSSEVTLGLGADAPRGARLDSNGPKRGAVEWCPTPDQIDAAERWAIALTANDGEHAPTEKTFVVVLRRPPKSDCPGEPPIVRVVSPTAGQVLPAHAAVNVQVTALDENGIREPPIVYYTTTAPESGPPYDLSRFSQALAELTETDFIARLPPVDVAPGTRTTVYVVASATDNDDSTGTACDHRTDTLVTSFVVDGDAGGATGAVDVCGPCTASSQCISGVCANAPDGARCIDVCGAGDACEVGTCALFMTVEGTSTTACGSVRAVCAPSAATCTDDAREDNDTVATATTGVTLVSDGVICAGDPDYFRIGVAERTRVRFVVDGFHHPDGDLDLQLVAADGAVLSVSEGTTDTESVTYCASSSASIYARVYGFGRAQNRYHAAVTITPEACCADDAGEDDDSLANARVVVPGMFSGTICPRDDDWLAFDVVNPAHVRASLELLGEHGDLDLELVGPSGEVIASSRGVTAAESLEADVGSAGRYALRVLGYSGAAGMYRGVLTLTESAPCSSTRACPLGTVCAGDGRCRAVGCDVASDCPPGHDCISDGGDTIESRCALRCTAGDASPCRDREACKVFPTGGACVERGFAPLGAACETNESCVDSGVCMPWSGGYCAPGACSVDTDCGDGGFCVAVAGTNRCLASCWVADEQCRLAEGYRCALDVATSGALTFVCEP